MTDTPNTDITATAPAPDIETRIRHLERLAVHALAIGESVKDPAAWIAAYLGESE